MKLRVAFLNKEVRKRQWNGRFDKNGSGRFSVIPSKSQVVLDWPRSLGNWCVLCANSTRYQVDNTDTSTDISSRLEEISPLLLNSLDLKGLTTLVVENLFAKMKQGNEMLLVLPITHRFSSASTLRNAASYTTLVCLHTIPKELVSCRLINFPPCQSLSEMP